jgi:hypothetical protein
MTDVSLAACFASVYLLGLIDKFCCTAQSFGHYLFFSRLPKAVLSSIFEYFLQPILINVHSRSTMSPYILSIVK